MEWSSMNFGKAMMKRKNRRFILKFERRYQEIREYTVWNPANKHHL
jgi:hypothetical protein